jgi:hypothetical protein
MNVRIHFEDMDSSSMEFPDEIPVFEALFKSLESLGPTDESEVGK